MKTIRFGRGRELLILELYGLHDVHSHDEDGSKYLKYDHCPEHRQSVMRRVRHARKDLTAAVRQLGGFIFGDNFGSLTEFCAHEQ
jgi:hypothetical protein